MELLWIPRTPTAVAVGERPARNLADELSIDRQTFRDLEIFEAEGGGPGLFELLNRTRTAGGARILQSRFRHPFSNATKIRGVQDSIRHILANRAIFNDLPSDGTISALEQYLHCATSVLSTRNPVEFLIEALEVRFGELQEYMNVVRGVHRTAGMIAGLRRLTEQPALQDAPGELGPWLQEMRELLSRPALGILPKEGEGELASWRIMRMDRMLRMDERTTVERLMRLSFDIDALVSMADVTQAFNYTMPEVCDEPGVFIGKGIYHPFLTEPVANPLHVDQQQRLLFITGPNMAGKTTYLRACGIAIYLASLGMGVPATSLRFSPCNNLFSAIALTDNVREGVSFFRAEALRVKTIARAIADGRNIVALLDEPFKGTNLKDALDASRIVLEHLARKQGSVFLVSSHLIELGDSLAASGNVQCCRFEANESAGTLEFDYVLRPGISSQRLGVRVLREEGVFALLDSDAAEGINVIAT